jgi:hypothetical protein
MRQFAGKPVRALVIWEPVLPTDWSAPSTAALSRIPDTRAAQFWDKSRLISHSMGEHDRRSIVWDYIAVYPAGAVWEDAPPQSLYDGRPVARVTQPARAALAEALQGIPVQVPLSGFNRAKQARSAAE